MDWQRITGAGLIESAKGGPRPPLPVDDGKALGLDGRQFDSPAFMNASTSGAGTAPKLSGITGLVRQLVLDGVLGEQEARAAMAEATKARVPIQAYLAERKIVSARALAQANATQFGLPLLDVNMLDLRECPLNLVSEDLIQKHHLLPLFKRGNRLFIGISDPTNTRAIDEVRFQASLTVESVIIDRDQLALAIDTFQQLQLESLLDRQEILLVAEKRLCRQAQNQQQKTRQITHENSSTQNRSPQRRWHRKT